MTRPAYLLEVTGETVERKNTIALQYWHAMKLNTEEAWLTVERNFPLVEDPRDRVYAWQAKQRLAEFYRENSQPEKAMRLYTELADSNEIEFAVLGRVGKANLLYEQRKQDLATAELGEAAALLAQLPQDEQIRKVLQWLVPDLRATFLEVTHGVQRLEKLSPDSMFE